MANSLQKPPCLHRNVSSNNNEIPAQLRTAIIKKCCLGVVTQALSTNTQKAELVYIASSHLAGASKGYIMRPCLKEKKIGGDVRGRTICTPMRTLVQTLWTVLQK